MTSARDAADKLSCGRFRERAPDAGGSAGQCTLASGVLLDLGVYPDEAKAVLAAEVVDEEVARYDLRAGRLLLVCDDRQALEQARRVFGGEIVDNQGRRLGR